MANPFEYINEKLRKERVEKEELSRRWQERKPVHSRLYRVYRDYEKFISNLLYAQLRPALHRQKAGLLRREQEINYVCGGYSTSFDQIFKDPFWGLTRRESRIYNPSRERPWEPLITITVTLNDDDEIILAIESYRFKFSKAKVEAGYHKIRTSDDAAAIEQKVINTLQKVIKRD